jgi:hypothetical protein
MAKPDFNYLPFEEKYEIAVHIKSWNYNYFLSRRNYRILAASFTLIFVNPVTLL